MYHGGGGGEQVGKTIPTGGGFFTILTHKSIFKN
jgi:hypothetical protein